LSYLYSNPSHEETQRKAIEFTTHGYEIETNDLPKELFIIFIIFHAYAYG